MKNTVKSLLLTAALSGLLSGAALAQQNGTPNDRKDQPKAEKNSCKGKAGCGAKQDAKKAPMNDAKDKNSCSANKGQQKDKNSCSANKGNGAQKPSA